MSDCDCLSEFNLNWPVTLLTKRGFPFLEYGGQVKVLWNMFCFVHWYFCAFLYHNYLRLLCFVRMAKRENNDLLHVPAKKHKVPSRTLICHMVDDIHMKYLLDKSPGQLSGLKFIIFISHKWSWVWTRYFIRLYIIISSTCVIFLWIYTTFCRGLQGFSRSCDLHQICSLYK